MKRTNISVYPDIEISLLNWFIQHRDLNVSINESILNKKTEFFATKLGHKQFRGNHRDGHAIEKFLNNVVFRKNVERSVCTLIHI